jgi:hypothetical protein
MEDEVNKQFLNEMNWAISDIKGSTAYSMDKNRPYDGQLHTNSGTRGKTVIVGLTMRDVADCFVKGFLDAGGIYRENPIWDDVYKLEMNDIDPIAVVQNAMCHIERMMGIFPNIPKLEEKDD